MTTRGTLTSISNVGKNKEQLDSSLKRVRFLVESSGVVRLQSKAEAPDMESAGQLARDGFLSGNLAVPCCKENLKRTSLSLYAWVRFALNFSCF